MTHPKYSLLAGPCSCPCHDHPGTLHFVACCSYTYQPRAQAEAIAHVHRQTEGMCCIGVVGYCPPTRFDEVEARRMIVEAFDKIKIQLHKDEPVAVVSGLTNVGVLKIAYEEAAARNWFTVGVACKRALEHPLFAVNSQLIVGEQWGEESDTFVGLLDCIIRIGTGKQSIREAGLVKGRGNPAFEYDLPVL